MADHMAEDGFKEAGYEYVSIDVSTFLVTCYQPEAVLENIHTHLLEGQWKL